MKVAWLVRVPIGERDGQLYSPLAGVRMRTIVPMLAASWPSAAQICRVKAATEVLPLVPVTAPTTRGCRG